MALGRPRVIVADHLGGDGNRDSTVHHRLDEEGPELFWLDRPADRRYAGLLEDKAQAPGRYLVGSAGSARVAEHLVRQRHLLALDVIAELYTEARVDVDRFVLRLPPFLRPYGVDDGRRCLQGAFLDQQPQDLVNPQAGVPKHHSDQPVSPIGQGVTEPLVFGLGEDVLGYRGVEGGNLGDCGI